MMASSSIHGKEAEDEISTLPNWLELPIDITTNILQRLPTIDIVTSACLVCPLWWNICKDPLIWRTIHMSNLDYLYHSDQHLLKICRYAVERSCGHLENVHVEYFASNNLLQCIAKNAKNLRCMRLVNCWRISDKGLRKAVRKIPLLEELDISYCNLSKGTLDVVGRSCPLLKSFTFWTIWCDYLVRESFGDDDDAFVIAETMSGLRYLDIKGNDLTNVGLTAILNGCPLLEYLDIQECYNLDVSGSFMKRCFQQIKEIRLPII